MPSCREANTGLVTVRPHERGHHAEILVERRHEVGRRFSGPRLKLAVRIYRIREAHFDTNLTVSVPGRAGRIARLAKMLAHVVPMGDNALLEIQGQATKKSRSLLRNLGRFTVLL